MNNTVVSSIYHYYKVFYHYIGKKLYILIFFIFLSGISEVIGLSMVLPIVALETNEIADNTYIQYIYHIIELTGLEVSLSSLLIFLIITFILKGCFIFLEKVIVVYTINYINKSLKIELCNRYKLVDYKFHINTNIGFINNLLIYEVNRFTSSIESYILVITNIITIIIFLSFTFVINWKMTIVVILVSGFMFYLLRQLSKINRKISILLVGVNANVQFLLIQIINNFKYLKAVDNFKQIFKQLFNKIENVRAYNVKNHIILGIPKSIVEPVSMIILSSIIIYNVEYRGETLASTVVFIVFFYRAFGRVFSLQRLWQQFNASVGSVDVVERTSKEFNVHKESFGNREAKIFEKSIEIKNVDFSYNSKKILHNINIVIPHNKAIAIIGGSGTGKTTIIDLIVGLIKPDSGKIYYDDVSYNELDMISIRKKIGYVTQEAVIFNDTIGNNISFWEGIDNEALFIKRLQDSAELANCIDFINQTENGFDTIIGDKGVKLSGGQRQRISIAREIFRDPDILIFDEATSSLDTNSETYIQKSIHSMMGKKTIIIISHRLSTIKNCDYIYILDDGRVVEEGSYQDLYANKKTRFFKMCEMQNLS